MKIGTYNPSPPIYRMITPHMTLVWYRNSWRIAQFGAYDGEPQFEGFRVVEFIADKASSLAAHLLPYATKYDKVRAGEVAPSSAKSLTNIEALNQALDNDVTITDKEVIHNIELEASSMARDAAELSYSQEIESLTPEERKSFKAKHAIRQGVRDPVRHLELSLSKSVGAGILNLVAYATDKILVKLEVKKVVEERIEWVYVLDLDIEVLEVYSGIDTFWKNRSPQTRFDDEEFLPQFIPPAWQGRGPIYHKRPYFMLMYDFADFADLTMESFVTELREQVVSENERGGNDGGLDDDSED